MTDWRPESEAPPPIPLAPPPTRYEAVAYGAEAVLGEVAGGSAVLVADVADWLRGRAGLESSDEAKGAIMRAVTVLMVEGS